MIKASTISNAGKGVFVTKQLEKNTYFGPYTGKRHTDFQRAQESGYAWSIADKNGKVIADSLSVLFVCASPIPRWFTSLTDAIQSPATGCDT